ncbi:MAG: glycosyltransferase [Acidobacteria bacterium]|nr:MAG: glycosyltransferase [Acidobacteriota bacterium]
MLTKHSVDLLYLACNRLEFTRESFSALLQNTDWDYVRELVLYDDGSEDGTCEWLENALRKVRFPHRLLKTRFGSPITCMSHFIESAVAPVLGKVDNDAMVPPRWLNLGLDVIARHSDLDLLGLEALYPCSQDLLLPRSYAPSQFIGGLGLFRRSAFHNSRPEARDRYYGFQDWQITQNRKRGWITPAIPVFLLDRCPFAPWDGYSDRYKRLGWQRPFKSYSLDSPLWRWRWPDQGSSPQSAELKLNFAWCGAVREDFSNIDILPCPEQEGTVDLRKRWPWPDGSIQSIRAADLVEHLPDKIFTMNELWRILRPGGQAEIAVPTTDGTGAWQDPTHVSFWNRRSFDYFEENNPCRRRFASRYGITARFRPVSENRVQSIDGPRITLVLEAVKGSETTAEVAVKSGGDPRFLCAMRVKNEADHIHEALSRALALCDRAFVFDDHSTDDTPQIAASFGSRVTVIHSPFVGLDEARDKNHLLQRILVVRPEWVLWIDGDEILERSAPTRLLCAARSNRVAVYSLRVAYLWNDPGYVRVDGLWGSFRRPSLFTLKGQPCRRLTFRATGHGGNFHCGSVPEGLIGRIAKSDVRLKHYGYLSPEQRRRKFEWYNSIDPNNESEDHYRHLAEIPGARHAPGPVRVEAWVE